MQKNVIEGLATQILEVILRTTVHCSRTPNENFRHLYFFKFEEIALTESVAGKYEVGAQDTHAVRRNKQRDKALTLNVLNFVFMQQQLCFPNILNGKRFHAFQMVKRKPTYASLFLIMQNLNPASQCI